MEGYCSKINLTRKEIEAIPLLMIIRKLGEIMWLFSQYKKGRLSNKEKLRFMKNSVEQLTYIVSQYERLKRIFEEIYYKKSHKT